MVSIVDVARLAGVSQATVSRVLGGTVFVAEETRQRVTEAISTLDYQPNSVGRALRSGKLNAVAFVVNDLQQGWYSTLAKHLQTALASIDMEVLLFDLGHSEEKLRRILANASSMGLRGIALATSDIFHFDAVKKEIERIRERNVSIISLGQRLDQYGIGSILHDDLRAAREAVVHLASRGRKRIAYLNRISLSVPGQQRYEGYLDGLRHLGLSVDPALRWGSPMFRFEGGYRAVSEAIDKGLAFDAILAGTDELALGAMAAAADAGRKVPDDLSIMGFSGLDWGQYTRPSLTTMGTNTERIASHYAHELVEPTTPLITVNRKLIVRQST